MTTVRKWPLISESVIVIQIDVHNTGKEPDQHVVGVAHWVSRTTTFSEVPAKSKSDPYSQDEFWSPSDCLARPSYWAAAFSLY
jgi:hypothetical protein